MFTINPLMSNSYSSFFGLDDYLMELELQSLVPGHLSTDARAALMSKNNRTLSRTVGV